MSDSDPLAATTVLKDYQHYSKMGRWTQYDEDDYRLPEGMKKVGYDSDSGRYFFRDLDGKMYQGHEGSEFGELTQISDSDAHMSSDDSDLEAAPSRADGYKPLSTESGPHYTTSNTSAYRTIFPFFLLISIVLLLIWRLIIHPSYLFPPPSSPSPPCASNTTAYWVKSGDSCWRIAQSRGIELARLRELNGGVDCEKLMPGKRLCLPEPE